MPLMTLEARRARRNAVVSARLSGRTLAEIGAELGLTRERVRQILRDIPQPHIPRAPRVPSVWPYGKDETARRLAAYGGYVPAFAAAEGLPAYMVRRAIRALRLAPVPPPRTRRPPGKPVGARNRTTEAVLRGIETGAAEAKVREWEERAGVR